MKKSRYAVVADFTHFPSISVFFDKKSKKWFMDYADCPIFSRTYATFSEAKKVADYCLREMSGEKIEVREVRSVFVEKESECQERR